MSDSDPRSIERQVRAVIGRTFGLPENEWGGDLRMGNPAGWDSMGHMTLITSLEEECGWSCPTHQIADLTDVRSIVDAIRGSKN